MVGDIHVHSSFSTDSDADMEEVIKKAIQTGLPCICFTDHIDWDFPVADAVYDFDLDEYFKTLTALKLKYRDRIKVLAGVELGLQPHLSGRYKNLLKSRPFDFAIGSQHLVYNMDPYYPETFEGRTESEVYRKYFEETLEGVKAFHDFDSMGHLDYIVRYGKRKSGTYSYRAYADIIDEILKLLVRYNIAIELNTAGIRKQLGHPNPHPDILRRYRDLGGTLVTLGSDSHKEYSLGFAFDTACEILRSCGFTHTVYYEKRQPKFVRL